LAINAIRTTFEPPGAVLGPLAHAANGATTNTPIKLAMTFLIVSPYRCS
jgi:hypothetical protein